MVTKLPEAGTPPPVPGTTTVQFHVAVKGQQTGPFPISILQQRVAAGTFTAASLVWRQGMAGWQAASTVPELVSLFAPTTPPPVPPPIPPAS